MMQYIDVLTYCFKLYINVMECPLFMLVTKLSSLFTYNRASDISALKMICERQKLPNKSTGLQLLKQYLRFRVMELLKES